MITAIKQERSGRNVTKVPGLGIIHVHRHAIPQEYKQILRPEQQKNYLSKEVLP